jgi:plastocyanin
MLLIALLALSISFLRLGAAQSSSSTSSAAVPTHSISVGAVRFPFSTSVHTYVDILLQEGLVFTPNQLTADVGDVLEFRFYPQNHSVARSDFKSPCIPYEDTGIDRQGFWSKFRWVHSRSPLFSSRAVSCAVRHALMEFLEESCLAAQATFPNTSTAAGSSNANHNFYIAQSVSCCRM